jgi:hypothetical protein
MLSLLHILLLPLISFLSGIISLYIDPKIDKAISWIVIANKVHAVESAAI